MTDDIPRANDWKAVALLEGWEEVWVRFRSEELDREVCVEICSVEDLIHHFIGDDDDISQKIVEDSQ